MDLEKLIRDVQSTLNLAVDGKAGPATWAAIHQALVKQSVAPTNPSADFTGGPVDQRSETNILTLHPRVQTYARSFVRQAAAAGITIKIISGLRSYDEQNALYAQGRTKPGKKVTNAPAGYSNHNFGIAFDIGIWQGGKYLEDSPLYKAVATIGISLGLEWGGNWKNLQDQPHYQLRPSWAKDMPEGVMLTELRRRKGAGIDYFS